MYGNRKKTKNLQIFINKREYLTLGSNFRWPLFQIHFGGKLLYCLQGTDARVGTTPPGRLSSPPGTEGHKPARRTGRPAGLLAVTAFPLMCGGFAAKANGAESVRKSVPGLSGYSLAAKGGNECCWSGCLWRSAAETQTDRRASTAFLIGSYMGTAAGIADHRPGSSASA